MSNLKETEYLPFEGIKQIDEKGGEFWYARDLQVVLQYKQWRNFNKAIDRAMLACKHSNISISDHFAEVSKMVEIGSGATKNSTDFKLTRYACYLIVQNGDPRKEIIALGQTYFAVQTRRQELSVAFDEFDENNKRLVVRNQISQSNQLLAQAAYQADIKTNRQFGIFQNHGYRGLYGGLTVGGIHKRKGLNTNQKILDYMGSTELGANLFRITQTEARLTKEKVMLPEQANSIHHEVGKKIRSLMKDMNSELPENLAIPNKSIQDIEREEIFKIKNINFPLMLDE